MGRSISHRSPHVHLPASPTLEGSEAPAAGLAPLATAQANSPKYWSQEPLAHCFPDLGKHCDAHCQAGLLQSVIRQFHPSTRHRSQQHDVVCLEVQFRSSLPLRGDDDNNNNNTCRALFAPVGNVLFSSVGLTPMQTRLGLKL